MIKKWWFGFLIIGIVFVTCDSDEFGFDDLPQDEQNQIDDESIVEYLNDHYFDPDKGLIKKYDAEDEEDDDYPSLKSLGIKLNSGVWIIKRPGVVAEGPAVTDNTTDSILISYNSTRFKATNDLEAGEKSYGKYSSNFFNTIYSSGTPAWDPVFYYQEITESMTDNGVDMSYFLIEGFLEGLKEFKSTQTNGTDVYNFQGAIVVPSRAAYGRDLVFINGVLDQSTYRDNCFVFNFELHKVLQRAE
ncbi:MAG: hypothetical protein WDA08_06920 [Weeksellaceae bacterium]